ncbi:MAG TPA: DUF6152 family protein [Candidatus Acidoferrum sp.]|nr:DUF6152 family protein [Candidatus Acidoferrum sp.]
MRVQSISAVFAALLVTMTVAPAAEAHHSFAVFDFKTEVPFEGIVESVKFRNPHIALTLKVKGADGKEQIVEFIEGAPANMLVRGGLRPEEIAPGKHINAIGSPLIEDHTKYFLRVIKLDDGQEFRN